MDEELKAELREQFLAAGCDEDTADEALAAVAESLEPSEIRRLMEGDDGTS